MAQSLYRKYRPQTFTEIVGQEHVERTITNAVADGAVSHAYLFCGPRGTGKTTTARLLAKALLCDLAPTATPDGTCEQCVEIADGTHPDVHELDAASRTGVDAVREEIIGRVQFAPTRGAYKVYIIDEVHMLSTAAFNALLKTLEEPPPHVVFIMCTTHAHKVPDTILSRCQRFDFHRISEHDIGNRLSHIADSEGFTTEREAIALIAQHATGGMRDAITTLEQLAAFTGGKITVADVEELIGEVDESQIFAISEAIAKRDMAACFACSEQLAEQGVDIAQFTKDFTAHVRDLYVFTIVGEANKKAAEHVKRQTRLGILAEAYGDPDRLARMLEIMGDLSRELRDATDPRLRLEIAMTRLARPQSDLTISALDERVSALEKDALALPSAPIRTVPSAEPLEVAATAKLSVAESAEAAVQNDVPVPQDMPKESVAAASPNTQEVPASPQDDVEVDLAMARRVWPNVVAQMKRTKASRGAMFSSTSVDVTDDGMLVIVFPEGQDFSAKRVNEKLDIKEFVDTAIQTVLHRRVPFLAKTAKEAGAQTPSQVVPQTTFAPAPPVQEEAAPAPGVLAPTSESTPEPPTVQVNEPPESTFTTTSLEETASVPSGDFLSALASEFEGVIVEETEETPAANENETN